MSKIHVSKYSGILSAYGLAAADVVHEEQQPSAAVFGDASKADLWQSFQNLTRRAVDALRAQGFAEDKIVGACLRVDARNSVVKREREEVGQEGEWASMSCGVEFGAGNTWFWTHVQHLFISSPSLSPPPPPPPIASLFISGLKSRPS